jgi:hypothetical protein
VVGRGACVVNPKEGGVNIWLWVEFVVQESKDNVQMIFVILELILEI